MALYKGDCDKCRKDSLVKKDQKVKNMLSVKYHKTLTGSVINTRCLSVEFFHPSLVDLSLGKKEKSTTWEKNRLIHEPPVVSTPHGIQVHHLGPGALLTPCHGCDR